MAIMALTSCHEVPERSRMDVATLIRRCPGIVGRALGDPPAQLVAGVAVWERHAPVAWDGGRYVGDGHGLTLILRGRGSFPGGDGLRRQLVPGCAIHHLPGCAVSGVLPGPAAELWVAFGRSLAARLAPLGLLRHERILQVGLDAGLLNGFAALHAGMRAAIRPGDAPRLLAQALSWLQEAYARADRSGTADAWRERIDRACQLLLRDLAAPLDLDGIARALDTTPLVLRRRFRRAMGCSPTAWWRLKRLAFAAELLSDHAVAEVARLVGYADPSALAKQLHRHLGRTPRSFRARIERGVHARA
jgi:AraC-like DNA-binding protein